MANKKFSEFVLKTSTSDVSHIVGYNGAENVQITPANFVTGGGTGVFLPLAGGTMTGVTQFNDHTQHGDQVKAKFGASNDLEIYHDANNSYIKDLGTGDLNITSNGTGVNLQKNTSEYLARFLTDAAVELYHDNIRKFQTTSTGISVTGDGLFSGDITIDNGSPELYLTPDATKYSWMIAAQENVDQHFEITPSTTVGGTTFNAPALKINGSDSSSTFAGEVTIDSSVATLNLEGSDSGSSRVNFGDASDSNVGRIDYDHSSNYMQFKTNDSEAMRLDSSGNLGLGVSSASQRLHVKSATTYQGIFINGNVAPNIGFAQNDATTPDWKAGLSGNDGAAFSISEGAASVDRLIIKPNGNVGIGTATPTYTVDTLGSTQYALRLNTSDANGCFLSLQTNGVVKSYIGTSYHLLTGSPSADDTTIRAEGNLQFASGGGNERMRISSAGALTVGSQGSTVLTTTIIENDKVALNVGDGTGAATGRNLTFSTGNSEKMRLTSAGVLQVGGTDTGYGSTLIQTGSFSTAQAGINILTNATGYAYMLFGFGSGANLYRGQIAYKQGDDFMAFQTASTEKMRLDSSGNLLVGKDALNGAVVGAELRANGQCVFTADGDNPLDLNRLTNDGAIANFRQDTTVVGSISVTGSATAYNTSSDYRLKEDLQDFKGLDLVSKIPVYDFKWKTDESRSYGVMAHELEEVLPQAVTGEKDAEEMQSVDYSKIVPLLVKSIQELSAKLEALECQCEKK